MHICHAAGSALIISAILLGILPATLCQAAEPPRWTLKTTVNGRTIEGWPLKWGGGEVHLMGRDGRLWNFRASQATDYKKISSDFRSFSPAEMRSQLIQEFRGKFDVSGTGHYLVVHPKGQRDYWASRFEELHRSFVRYFRVRGLTITPAEFPLVAIVVPKKQDLYNYAQKEGSKIRPGTLGYYSPVSNRVILFDQGGGKASQDHWADNSATIIHEATHQTAYNTGIHNRMAATPVWVAEGLATMFEARGVWNSRLYREREDRIVAGQLAYFKQRIAAKFNGGVLAGFISTDRPFETSPRRAYCTAWALTFFLVEKYPRQYASYIARTARHPALKEYTRTQRLRDFTTEFGDNFPLLNARFLRFIAALEPRSSNR